MPSIDSGGPKKTWGDGLGGVYPSSSVADARVTVISTNTALALSADGNRFNFLKGITPQAMTTTEAL